MNTSKTRGFLGPALVALVLACALSLAGCGDDDATSATKTVTVVRPAAAPEPTSATASPESPPPPAAKPSNTIVVPDVVGKDHQLAQDTMQAAGLYMLAEEDATGQGRALVWDRNWTVVSQSPKLGGRVAPDTTIVLRSKKDNE
ncbi:MAG: PASTA domain-containing protein [Solirubrobacteraceae bacterium]|nr:PASTA domain-containing protein [Solirubrobacteraceae bacterium]